MVVTSGVMVAGDVTPPPVELCKPIYGGLSSGPGVCRPSLLFGSRDVRAVMPLSPRFGARGTMPSASIGPAKGAGRPLFPSVLAL